MDDQELLREYVERQSEKAFADLVARHIDMVYSTALRIVQDTGLAKDVTQSVFIRLAQKAPTIRSGHSLPGWLYHVAHGQAVNAVRDDRTRRERETEAMTMNSPEEDINVAWKSILPHLDDAMSLLKTAEKNAIVLRFFEGRSWREVGAALSLNEDTAQKRVVRALDKLRLHFRRRGIVLSAVAIAGAVAANSVQAAPAGFASTMAMTAYAAGTNSFSLLTFVQTLLMKKTTYAALSAALIAAITVPVIMAQANGPSDAPVTRADLQSGLILHYTSDSPPVNGKVADASGAGNDGWISGAQWEMDPQRGGAFHFSPPGQYIRVPNNNSLNPSNITLAAWIKTSNQGDTWRRVFDKSFTNGYALSIGGGHTTGNSFQSKAVVEIAMRINNQKGSVRSDHIVTDGKWHHLAVTYDGLVEIIYVDGVRQVRVAHWTGRVPANAYDLTIGMNLVDPNPVYNEVNASFDGLIGEPMIYERALSAAEIKFLFESQHK